MGEEVEGGEGGINGMSFFSIRPFFFHIDLWMMDDDYDDDPFLFFDSITGYMGTDVSRFRHERGGSNMEVSL